MTPVDQAARTRIRDDTAATLFVEAGAGSGKTTSLVNRVTTLVVQDGIPLSRIAAVTFTEKAGAELRDKLRTEFTLAQAGAVGDEAERLQMALGELDGAAFGTLHSFAQRVLMMYPIQAEVPPLIEVLDEVASSVRFEQRWSATYRELLDDPSMSDALLLALSSGIKAEDLRSLARALGDNWDLISGRVLAQPVEPFHFPDVGGLAEAARALGQRRDECHDPADRFLERLLAIGDWGRRLEQATSDGDRMALLAQASDLRTSYGRAANWSDLVALKADCDDLKSAAAEAHSSIADAVVKPIARWLSERVLRDADERRAEGRLEFQDLLVIARDLVRRNAEVRAGLQTAFPRLLLDEFQDTDPIQIELAVRIAAGADGGGDDWRAIHVPDGALFVVGDPKQSIYRFRRASIETYLEAQDRLGELLTLTANFRSVPTILDWVNSVFAKVIRGDGVAQPEYRALEAHRSEVGSGPAVAVLGAMAHDDKPKADMLREREAADVAAAITQALAEGWTVWDPDGNWRPVRARDIVVLVPARTSLPYLQDALEDAGLHYRAEASSIVYQTPEIRDLMATLRAIADPSDRLALLTALRSPLFGCADDELFVFVRDGGRFTLNAREQPESLVGHPVNIALESVRTLASLASWRSPSELLEAIVEQRRLLEVAEQVQGAKARDTWRRVRFVIDQARAWADVQRGGLRDYVRWAMRQADESSRVAETVLPENDLNVVRVMTIHAAKGLEFPMVVLSGMTSQPRNVRGVQLIWPRGGGYAVRLRSSLQTNDFTIEQPIDEQMDDLERKRLLYVAATRARDHLVISLHRQGGAQTLASVLADGGAVSAGAVALQPEAAPTGGSVPEPIAPPEDWAAWSARIESARQASEMVLMQSASGLEGTDPQSVLRDPLADEDETGLAKGPRDLDSPAWLKGRYGTSVGRAVHGVLQSVDLGTGAGLDAIVTAQCVAEGISQLEEVVQGFVRSALGAPEIAAAASSEHWRELYVGALEADGTVLEGFVDLVVRTDNGLVVIDYKTDAVPDGALDARTVYYAPQLAAYRRALEAATGEAVSCLVAFLQADGAPARFRATTAV